MFVLSTFRALGYYRIDTNKCNINNVLGKENKTRTVCVPQVDMHELDIRYCTY